VRVEIPGVHDEWYGELPGVRLERRVEGGVVLEIPDGFDEQRVLDLARSRGDVTHFSRVRPSLAELFREVVSA
jgi:ABC-2 type transport system ATP-binding protein